jgi:anti-anti-sigma factor
MLKTQQRPERVGPTSVGSGAVLRTLVARHQYERCQECLVDAIASFSVTVRGRDVQAFSGSDDRTVVVLRGEHDRATMSALSDTITRAIALDGTDLVVDLSGVEFIDGGTVGALVEARNFLWKQSRSLHLMFPSPCARRILDLCGVDYLPGPGSADANRRTGADRLPAGCEGL